MKQAKTKISHAKFWALLKQTNGYNEAYKDEIKASWVSEYSDGKFTSLSEFYAAKPLAYKRMIRIMELEAMPLPSEDRQQAQRRKLLALIYTFCKHKGHTCTTQQAVKIASKSCGVGKLNDASEQKLIAAIKRFDDDVIDMAVDELVKSCIN